MTTPTGTITLLDVQNEFGGSAPIELNEYYAGGAYVPSGTSGVPTSGTISLNDLRGKTALAPVQISVGVTTKVEGTSFFMSISPTTYVYPTVYWRLTDYNNLTDADFSQVSGSVNSSGNGYPLSTPTITPIIDSDYEGPGTFKFTCYSDAARTIVIGQTTTLTVTDYFNSAGVSLSRSSIYRYANLNTAFMTSVATLSISGLDGASIYYEIYSDSGVSVSTTDDIQAPLSLTGTVIASGGQASVAIQARSWNGNQNTPLNGKNIYVRFRLNNAAGAFLGESSAIYLYPTPVFSAPMSPGTIREGQAAAISISMTNVPYGNVSVWYKRSTVLSGAQTTDWLLVDGSAGVSEQEIFISSQNITDYIYAKVDTLTESAEYIWFNWWLNSSTGQQITGPNSSSFTIIDGQAIINSAQTTYDNLQITDISSYITSRSFTVTTSINSGSNRVRTLTVPQFGTSSNSAQVFNYVPTEGNPGTFTMNYTITSSGHQTYTVNQNETFIFPIYSFSITFGGTNSLGSSRTVSVALVSIHPIGTERTLTLEFRGKLSGTTEWGAWTSLVNVVVPANATSVPSIQFYGPTTSTNQFDLEFRMVGAGHETKYSITYNFIWLN